MCLYLEDSNICTHVWVSIEISLEQEECVHLNKVATIRRSPLSDVSQQYSCDKDNMFNTIFLIIIIIYTCIFYSILETVGTLSTNIENQTKGICKFLVFTVSLFY